MKKNKIKAFIVAMGLFMMLNTVVVSAVTSSLANSGNKLLFSEYLIYGSSYTKMAEGRLRATPYNQIKVKVDNMYKQDGSASLYTKSLWGVVYNGTILQNDIVVTKEVEKTITISSVTDPSRVYAINVKGNTTGYNARISGNISNFNMSN